MATSTLRVTRSSSIQVTFASSRSITFTLYRIRVWLCIIHTYGITYIGSPARPSGHPTDLSSTTALDPVTSVLLLYDQSAVVIRTIHCLSVLDHVL